MDSTRLLDHFRIDDCQSLKARNFCKRSGPRRQNGQAKFGARVEGDGELQGVLRSQTSREAVPSDKEFGGFEMLIGKTVNLDLAGSHVEHQACLYSSILQVQSSGATLNRKGRLDFYQADARNRGLTIRLRISSTTPTFPVPRDST